MLVCQITNACSITLTCQKMVVNIAVGRKGWLGNSLKLSGQIGYWPSQSLVLFPYPLQPRNMPFPTWLHLALPLTNMYSGRKQKTHTTILPAVRMHQNDQDVNSKCSKKFSIFRQALTIPLCPLDSGDAGDCPASEYTYSLTHTQTHTLEVCQPGACQGKWEQGGRGKGRWGNGQAEHPGGAATKGS